MARVRALVASGGVRVDGDVVARRRAAAAPRRAREALVEPERLQARALALDRPFELTAERVILLDDGILIAVDKPPGCRRTRPPTRRARASSGTSSGGSSRAASGRRSRSTSGWTATLGRRDLRRRPARERGPRERLRRAARRQEISRAHGVAAHGRCPARFRVSAAIGRQRRAGRSASASASAEARPAETDVLVREVPRRRTADRGAAAHRPPPPGPRPPGPRGPADPGRQRLRRARTAVPRLMLHAWRLALPHPITGEPLARAPIPRLRDPRRLRSLAGRS